MIKGLTGGPGVMVDGGGTSLPWTNTSSGDTFAGVMRISGGELQYYNAGAWTNMPSSYATVRLDPSAEAAMRWVQDKMAWESSERASRDYMKRRAKEIPALAKALESIERAEETRDQEVKDAIANFHILDKIAGEPVNDAGMEMPMSAP